jgi:hypothetical protein
MAPEICLLLDQCDAHDTPTVRDDASKLNIHLVFIPKGGTGKYQSLNQRVFGVLKSKERAKWTRHYETNPGKMCTRKISADLLLTFWAELDKSCIVAVGTWVRTSWTTLHRHLTMKNGP